MTPYEKTRRRPRIANVSGRNRSSARTRQRRGKSAKLVFAESASTATTEPMVT